MFAPLRVYVISVWYASHIHQECAVANHWQFGALKTHADSTQTKEYIHHYNILCFLQTLFVLFRSYFICFFLVLNEWRNMTTYIIYNKYKHIRECVCFSNVVRLRICGACAVAAKLSYWKWMIFFFIVWWRIWNRLDMICVPPVHDSLNGWSLLQPWMSHSPELSIGVKIRMNKIDGMNNQKTDQDKMCKGSQKRSQSRADK